MDKIAIFPGSFDPFTLGHKAIVERGLTLFDKVVVGIGFNESKKGFFSLEMREKWIKDTFANMPNVVVERYNCLTVDFCKAHNARFILRGVRDATDYEYEKKIAQVNSIMYPELETVFLLTSADLMSVTSSIVREIYKHKGDVKPFIPKEVVLP